MPYKVNGFLVTAKIAAIHRSNEIWLFILIFSFSFQKIST